MVILRIYSEDDVKNLLNIIKFYKILLFSDLILGCTVF